jgi:hypothetical protein
VLARELRIARRQVQPHQASAPELR